MLPRTEVTIDDLVLVSGNYAGPATVGVDVSYRGEKHRILVHIVRENEHWLVANVIYDAGKEPHQSLSQHHTLTHPTLSAVIVRESGRSSIPETSVIEPRSRGVLGPPLSRGMTAVLGVKP